MRLPIVPNDLDITLPAELLRLVDVDEVDDDDDELLGAAPAVVDADDDDDTDAEAAEKLELLSFSW